MLTGSYIVGSLEQKRMKLGGPYRRGSGSFADHDMRGFFCVGEVAGHDY
jgi:hypothetical protein